MKQLFSLFLFLSFNFVSVAQSNEVQVIQVPSPIKNVNYNSPDSSDIVIRVKNVGPNTIESFDSLFIRYTVSQANSREIYDTTLVAGRDVVAGSAIAFTLREDFRLEGKGQFSVCAEVRGTFLYPSNPNKKPSACSSFLVSIEEIADLKPTKVYFQNGHVLFDLKQLTAGRVEIYDITGKILQTSNLDATIRQSVNLKDPAKGFYFLKLINKSGNNSISKFVVNQ